MAFMMPVMKNNYEIYPRSRKNSESAASAVSVSVSAAAAAARRRSSAGGGGFRGSRPVSRTVSESERGNSGNHDVHFLSASPPLSSSALYSSSAPACGTAFANQNQLTRLSSVHGAHHPRTVRFIRSASQESDTHSSSRKSSSASCRSVASSSSSTTATSSADSNVDPAAHSPRSFGSAFGKFHSKLVDKLKRKLKLKDTDDVDLADEDEDRSPAIRSST